MTERELRHALEQVELTPAGRQRILETSRQRISRKENPTMKKKKLAIAAIAAACVLTIGAVAAGGAGIWYSSSSSIPDYTRLPTAAEMDTDVGYHGKAVEAFSNGYVFDSAGVVRNVLESDGQQERFKSLTLRYEKDGAEVELTLQRFSGAEDHKVQAAETHGGADLYAYAFINRTVPEDYILSPEDLALEQAGEVYYSYDGSDRTEDHQVRSVQWTMDGVAYDLMQIDGPLTLDELLAMAEEVIDAA